MQSLFRQIIHTPPWLPSFRLLLYIPQDPPIKNVVQYATMYVCIYWTEFCLDNCMPCHPFFHSLSFHFIDASNDPQLGSTWLLPYSLLTHTYVQHPTCERTKCGRGRRRDENMGESAAQQSSGAVVVSSCWYLACEWEPLHFYSILSLQHLASTSHNSHPAVSCCLFKSLSLRLSLCLCPSLHNIPFPSPSLDSLSLVCAPLIKIKEKTKHKGLTALSFSLFLDRSS